MSFNKKVLEKIFNSGKLNVFHKLQPNQLSVLNYHRIDNPTHPDFDTFKPNISATIEDFSKQMKYLVEHFNVVSIEIFSNWLDGKEKLPPQAAMVTFDDGYLDNYKNAFPILKNFNIPAIIFLTSNYIGKAKLFNWDLIAYCFHHTPHNQANIPIIGYQAWTNISSRDNVMRQFTEKLKLIPNNEIGHHLIELSNVLDTPHPGKAFASLQMTWDQVREMASEGIDFGGHTESHPILTRVSRKKASEELINSKQRIETELGKRVISFAYPNGKQPDFNSTITNLVRDAGYEVAFTLLSGPTSFREVRANPLAIRRIFVSYKDSLSRFGFKLSGFQRLLNQD